MRTFRSARAELVPIQLCWTPPQPAVVRAAAMRALLAELNRKAATVGAGLSAGDDLCDEGDPALGRRGLPTIVPGCSCRRMPGTCEVVEAPAGGQHPQPTGFSKAEVERLAGRFAAKVGYVPAAPIDLVVKQLGGEIEFRDLDDLTNQTGSLNVRGRGDFTIFLPWYTGRLRDRFTIAHELGHYVLHSRLGQQPIRVARAESNELEWEANWFAAALLMPQEEFARRYGAGKSIPYLADYFDVSPAAAEVRARALGLDQDRHTPPD